MSLDPVNQSCRTRQGKLINGLVALGVVCVLYALVGSVHAQQLNVSYKCYSVDDGLLHRKINSIAEDQNGFIWVSTPKGVQRFDGYNFKTWRLQDWPILEGGINSMGIDPLGYLWLWNGTTQEFSFLNTISDSIETVEQRFGKPLPEELNGQNYHWLNHQRQFKNDSKGALILINDETNSLVRFDEKGFEIIPIHGISGSYLFRDIDSQDNLWLSSTGSPSHIYRLSSEGNLISEYALPNANWVESIAVSGNDASIVYSDKSALHRAKLDVISGELTRITSGIKYPQLVSHGSVLQRFDDRWEIYSDLFDPVSAFTILDEPESQQLNAIIGMVGRDGQAWLGGEWGLAQLSIRPSIFRNYLVGDSIMNPIRGIYSDDDSVYFNVEFEGLRSLGMNGDGILSESRKLGLEFYTGYALGSCTNGKLQVGLESSLVTIDGSGRVSVKEIPGAGYIWSLLSTEYETLIGADNGLWSLDEKTGSRSLPLFPKGAVDSTVYQMHQLGNNQYWLCTGSGLFKYDKAKEKVLANYHRDAANDSKLPITTVYAMHVSDVGTYWIATKNGLVEWNPETNEHTLYDTQNGFSSDVIYSVFEDQHQNLWMSSENGIISMSIPTKTISTFLETDGISNNEFNRGSSHQTPDGTIYFGGINGITAFRPDDILNSETAEKHIRISDFEYYDGGEKKRINDVAKLRRTNTIELDPADHSFQLSFAILPPEDIKNVRYAWRFRELGESWSHQKSNEISVTGIRPGNYTLQIKGLAASGKWTEPLEINVIVNAPIYQQTWFLLLLVGGLITSVLFFFRWRTVRLRKQQIELENQISRATDQLRQDKQTIEEQADELRKLDETKSRFFANITHELRTPITLILGPISTLLKKAEISAEHQRILETARENSKYLLKMVQSLLDLSKLESSSLELHEEPTKLFSYTRRVVSNFESLAEQAGLNYLFEYKAYRNLQVMLDHERTETIINNLIQNAIKHSAQADTVKILVADEHDSLRIMVSDTGKGIHPDDMPHLFERFFQSKQANIPAMGGAGIGLALSQELAHLMKGKISVESTLGSGSTFTLSIPRNEVLGQVKTEDGEPTAVNTAIEQISDTVFKDGLPHIMVVEDNHSLRNYVHSILQEDYNVTLAVNGLQALEKLEGLDAAPDLIVSDIMMPEMDGYQLLARLRSSEKYSTLPVIMLTARAALEDKLKALRIGVDDYLLKPFEEEELLARLRNLLERSQVRREAKAEDIEELPDENQLWLEKLQSVVNANLAEEFTVEQLTLDMGMSESGLLKKVKALTGLSSSGYIREYRLNQARHLLENNKVKSVKEAAYDVGFQDQKAFSRSFKQRFGKSPSEYLA